jgi:hypothetical protein
MKGKNKLETGKNTDKSLGGDFYAGGQSEVAKEAKDKSEGFKRGGKTMMKKGGKAVKMEGMKAKADMGRMPRMAGGKVMSSAAATTPRGKSSHY